MKYHLTPWIAALLSLSLCATPAIAQEDAREYSEITATASALTSSKAEDADLEKALLAHMEAILGAWYGTTWGLGAPQTKTPHEGKINCGMFVGRTLVDAGFNINASKLQRQPAELIIKTLVPKSHIKRWRNKPTEAFIEGIKEMGPGLYIIGLDFHVGYLLVRPRLPARPRGRRVAVHPDAPGGDRSAGGRGRRDLRDPRAELLEERHHQLTRVAEVAKEH